MKNLLLSCLLLILACHVHIKRGQTLLFQTGTTQTNCATTVLWQTNGTDTAWWTTNSPVFSPSMDIGADEYNVHIWKQTSQGRIVYQNTLIIRVDGERAPGKDLSAHKSK